MNWTEKYRPKNMNEVIGQNKFTDDASWWIYNKEMPNVLIYGGAGTGKTSAAHAIANEILGEYKSTQFLEINASQDRRLDTIRETVANFASCRSNDEVPFKMILMDELDGMTKDSQRALKRTMERAYNVRFVITCNSVHEIDTPIRSRCANYLFNPVSVGTMVDVLWEIGIKEKLTMERTQLKVFAESLNGDMRRAINELQACAYTNKNGMLPLVEKSKEFISQYEKVIDSIRLYGGDEALDILLDEIYRGRSVKEITHNLHRIVLNGDEIKGTEKYKWLRLLGEMEWRSSNMTPKILVSWLVAQFYD